MFLKPSALAALLGVALALGACGGSDADAAPDWVSAELRACLHTAGALHATTGDDLGFFREDRLKGNVDTPGFFVDRRLMVRLYEPSTNTYNGQAYRVYVVEPWDEAAGSEEGPDPLQALEDGRDAAVWFIPNGGPARPVDVDGCFGAA